MPTMYEAASKNYRQVEKGLSQLERAITAAIRRSDYSSVESLTRVQLLLVSVKAEARLTKILYTPQGLTSANRAAILATDTARDRWRLTIDDAFRRHYKVPPSASLADSLDHDVLAKHSTLHSLVDSDLNLLISLRNKLAHGQWVMPFNVELTAVEPAAVAALNAESTLTLRYRDRLLAQLGNIVVDLVISAPSFEARFNQYFLRIRRYRNMLATANYGAWEASVRSTKVALGRVAPMSTPAVK